MMYINSNKLDLLIKEGDSFTWENNSYRVNGEFYGRLTDDYMAWIAEIEDYIKETYGTESSPYKLFDSAEIEMINGNYQLEFDRQHPKVIASLKACKRIKPKLAPQDLNINFLLNNIFNKFHSIVKQLRNRYDRRTTLDVEDEYDVQDLMHALLRLYFDDIRAEEWTPSYAGGSSRMDFLLKKEKIVLEIKKTRKGLNDKELGKQLIEDKARYSSHPDCKKLICFTYDPEGRIINPAGIQNDLNCIDDNLIVEIIIKP